MSAEILLRENYPAHWERLPHTYTHHDKGSYTVSASALSHLLKLEIIMDELMKAGIHNFSGWDDAMEAAQRRFKGEEE